MAGGRRPPYSRSPLFALVAFQPPQRVGHVTAQLAPLLGHKSTAMTRTYAHRNSPNFAAGHLLRLHGDGVDWRTSQSGHPKNLAHETELSVAAEIQLLTCGYSARCTVRRCEDLATMLARFTDNQGRPLRQWELLPAVGSADRGGSAIG